MPVPEPVLVRLAFDAILLMTELIIILPELSILIIFSEAFPNPRFSVLVALERVNKPVPLFLIMTFETLFTVAPYNLRIPVVVELLVIVNPVDLVLSTDMAPRLRPFPVLFMLIPGAAVPVLLKVAI